MDYNELQKYYNEIINSLVNNKLYNTFSLLQKLLKHCSNSDYQNKYENHYSTYQNLLKYSFEYEDDPEKENIYYKLLTSLLKLADEIREDILYSKRIKTYYTYKDKVNSYFKIDEKESTQLVDNIAFEKEIENILAETNVKSESNNNNIDSFKTRIENIFLYLWLANNYHQAELDLVMKIIETDKIPWYNKCLIVSAVSLSLLRYFDEKKFKLLFNISEKNEDQVWQRAIIGVFLALMYYDNRILLYPDIRNRLKVLQGDNSFIKNIDILSIQFIWQKESEKIAKKINEEILPDVMKMKSIIEDKLDLDNITSSDPLEDKNPDWEDYFKDSPDIYKKFEEIQKLQTDGADIFMGAFAMLKQFPFFKEITNWFLPFYKENDSVKTMKEEMKDVDGFENIINGLSSTFFLCNSDKYSFCHNLKYVMQTQKPKMMDMFKMELDAMNEMTEDNEKININIKNKSIFTQYLQDLYRFFMLYPERNDFENVFNLPIDLSKTNFMKMIAGDSKIIHKIGEFYFNQNYFDKALEIFQSLENDEISTDLLEKIAYCLQRIGNFDEAINYYNKALLIEKNHKWKLQQLAFCHRKKRDYTKALEYYKELEKSNPDDLNIQADIGQVYLGIEDYESALKYYFKIEYLAPENHKVQRPIAWCSFVLGNFDSAKKYFEKVIKKDKNKNDFLNLGHVLWCMEKRKEAINNYKTSISMSKNDYKWFENVMKEDSKHLIKHGIEKLDINLMVDFIKMQIQ